jgi:hypothetical protein
VQKKSNVHLSDFMSNIWLYCLYTMQFAASLSGGSFEESRMLKNVESCEWLTRAIRSLEVPNLDPCYVNMRAVSYPIHSFLSVCTFTNVKHTLEFLPCSNWRVLHPECGINIPL